MREFFRRIRIAWAVYKKDYEWLCNNALSLHRDMMQWYMYRQFTDEEEIDARLNASYRTVDCKRPFITVWKDVNGCYAAYCGTDEELKELMNQEIKID